MGRTIDIRNDKKESAITKIRIASRSKDTYSAEMLVKKSGDYFTIQDSDNHSAGLDVSNKAHAEHLIAGLQKAIELNWVK